MTVVSSTHALYRPFWMGGWGAILIASLGGWFAQVPLLLETSAFLGLQTVVTVVCGLYFQRYPEQTTALQLTIGWALTMLFLIYCHTTWVSFELDGVMYGILASPFALGIAVVWGWAGIILNLAALCLIAFIPSSHPEGRTLGLLVLALHSILGVTLGNFLKGFLNRLHELERSVSTDMLTQIGNRRALLEDFTKFQAAAQKKGVPLLLTSWDVDGLKRINDHEGHQAGDQFILSFVAALHNAVRQGDGLYRTGGDEFVALHLGLSSGGRLYGRVREKFSSVSGGWTRATNISLDQALTEADVQMYAEKRAHKAVITRIIGDSQSR